MTALARRFFKLLLLCCAAPFAAAADGDAQNTLVQRILRQDPRLLVLDVRTTEEFGVSHIVGAQNLPHDQLGASANRLPQDKAREIVVYCRSGRRSVLAVGVLQKLGYSHVEHLEGDFLGWQAANRPVEPQAPTH
jgi:rhodanese-related sulfurtransferase